jgi:hydrogenase maturation protease
MDDPRPCLTPRPTVVIGLGNPVMGDDGLGVAAVARLRDEWGVPPEVALVDGGTWGLNLLPDIEDAGRLLLVDAIDRGLPPGTEIVLEREEIPRYLAMKLSPHQVDLREVLALAELRGRLPRHVVAVGMQPERVELGVSLSPALDARLDRLVRLLVDHLGAWGHVCRARRRRERRSLGAAPAWL